MRGTHSSSNSPRNSKVPCNASHIADFSSRTSCLQQPRSNCSMWWGRVRCGVDVRVCWELFEQLGVYELSQLGVYELSQLDKDCCWFCASAEQRAWMHAAASPLSKWQGKGLGEGSGRKEGWTGGGGNVEARE